MYNNEYIKKYQAKTAVRIIFKLVIYIVRTIRLSRLGSQKPILNYKI